MTNGHKSSRKPLKTLQMNKHPKFPNMFILSFEEGGNIPEYLSGMYGNRVEAQKAIDGWVNGTTRNKIYPRAPENDIPQKLAQKPKVEENGEEQSIS